MITGLSEFEAITGRVEWFFFSTLILIEIREPILCKGNVISLISSLGRREGNRPLIGTKFKYAFLNEELNLQFEVHKQSRTNI